MSISDRIALGYIREKASVLFFILSTDGLILDANHYARAITGTPLVNMHFQDLIIDFGNTFALTEFVRDANREYLLNIKTATGLPQSFFLNFTPLGDKILALGRLDVQELETMRKEVLSLNQELNNLTRRLHKNNSLLQQLNEEKNRFLGMAAHDLRKPIGLVLTYSEFLIEEAAPSLSDEQMGFLNTIHSACFFMKRLVDDFLDVSAIEAGRFELDLQPARIAEVLEQSLKLNHFQAIKKGIALKIQSEINNPRVIIDASKIEQVISNLVSNAIEHSQPGTDVTIGLSSDQQSISFWVRDRGPGIAPEEMNKLFQPFGKTSAQKTGGEKSTGLGMLITRKIIEAHNGKIWVDSEPGRGTTVNFKLPQTT